MSQCRDVRCNTVFYNHLVFRKQKTPNPNFKEYKPKRGSKVKGFSPRVKLGWGGVWVGILGWDMIAYVMREIQK